MGSCWQVQIGCLVSQAKSICQCMSLACKKTIFIYFTDGVGRQHMSHKEYSVYTEPGG